MAWVLPIVDDFDGALREASLCRDHLRDQDDPFWTAMAIDTSENWNWRSGASMMLFVI